MRPFLSSFRQSEADEHLTLLKHELVHAHDMLVRGLDSNDDDALACMEIRAHRWAQCENSWFKQPCVKRHATRSIQMHFDNVETARELVERNYAKCLDRNDLV